jgi:hypothetical protein
MYPRLLSAEAEQICKSAYLTFCWSSIVVAIRFGAESSPWARSISTPDASSLCQVLLTLCLSNLDLLFFATPSQLFWLEGVLRLELSTTMLWDVAVRHDCDMSCTSDDLMKDGNRVLTCEIKSTSWCCKSSLVVGLFQEEVGATLKLTEAAAFNFLRGGGVA